MDITPSDATSSYMAINNLTMYGSIIIASAFIPLGTIFTPWIISGIYTILGMFAIYLFYQVVNGVKVTHTEDLIEQNKMSM